MIDTIRLSQRHAMHPAQGMQELGFSALCGHEHTMVCTHRPAWILNPPPVAGQSFPRITWNRVPNGQDYLLAEVSLPKMMFGSNVITVRSDGEVSQGLTMISDFVSERALVNYKAALANVSRVDFCHNFQMPPRNVSEYIKALSSTSISRTEPMVFQNQTVMFSNGMRTLAVYDKLQEVLRKLPDDEATNEDVRLAPGVLRAEVRFKTSRSCERLAKKLGFDNYRAETLLTNEIAERVLNESMSELGLDKPIETGDARYERLFEVFEPAQALALAGLMVVCDKYGAENVVRLGFCKRSTFCRKRRYLQDAGLWLQTARKHRLPALRIVSASEGVRAA